MQALQLTWQDKTLAKRIDTKSRIPKNWILERSDIEEAKKQRRLTGPFFEKFFDDHELAIIRNDSVQLVEKIRSQQYTAVEVAQTYCHAAAIAQQIVS